VSRPADMVAGMDTDPGMEIVQSGVTRPHLDPVAGASWLAVVYESMRTVGGTVTTAVENPTVGRNYYRVGVELQNGSQLTIVFNAAAALVAATERHDPHTVTATFANVPGSHLFRRAGLQVATAEELNRPVNEKHLSCLADDERRDVAYHRPSRLGDLLFNWFD
jgi:hypothetical protein